MLFLTVNVLRTPLQRRGESAGVRDREKNSLLCVSGFSFKRLTGAQCRPYVSRTEDTVGRKGGIDAEPDMLPGIPGSVVYVQNPDDSRNSAIRIAYRNSLRPSS